MYELFHSVFNLLEKRTRLEQNMFSSTFAFI